MKFWFNSESKLSIPWTRMSYGMKVDENGKIYELIAMICGNVYKEFRSYDPKYQNYTVRGNKL